MEDGHVFFLPYDFPPSSHQEGLIMATPVSRSLMALCGVFGASLLLAGAGETQAIFEYERSLPIIQVGTTIFLSYEELSIGDYDNDGWPDLAAATGWVGGASIGVGALAVLHNDGNGRFTRRDAMLQPGSVEVISGGAFGDCDNDGDLDLFSLGGNVKTLTPSPNALYRNDGAVFRDVGPAAGVADPLLSTSAVWLDYDRDGHLDLVQVYLVLSEEQGETQLRLYRNQGDCRFTDATEGAGLKISLNTSLSQAYYFQTRSKIMAADFTGDDWPDLYLTVPGASSNLLFHNSGQGDFRDATTSEVGDVGITHDLTIGDIDNDGDLDLFLHNVGTLRGRDLLALSTLLLNRGEGLFLDVTAGVGLGNLTGKEGRAERVNVGLGDIDNDGDLDLLRTASQQVLLMNQGDGMFVDRTSQVGDYHRGDLLALVDYNRDGFTDSFLGIGPALGQINRNTGNAHHWLQVVLTGRESNRYGVGARVVVGTGDRRQTRWIGGQPDGKQEELMAAWGLGTHTVADYLEVHWPSGRVDRLQDIPADQRIRVIEGSGQYHTLRPTVWEQPPPALVVPGDRIPRIAVRPARFDSEARITRVVADLSAFDGPREAVLTATEDGVFERGGSIEVAGPPGPRVVAVRIEQETSVGTHWTQLSRAVSVAPTQDRVILHDDLSSDWRIDAVRGAETPVFAGDGPVYAGDRAAALTVRQPSDRPRWRIDFRTPEPVPLFGYPILHLAFHPGDLTAPEEGGTLSLFMKGVDYILSPAGDKEQWGLPLIAGRTEHLTIDMTRPEWQILELPLDVFDPAGTLGEFRLLGNLEGTFYVDDVRMVSAASLLPSSTVVQEERTDAQPPIFTLAQNYPNPFNSETVIRFALPMSANIELTIYNLAGQKVATLVDDMREAGTYTICWDGKDDRENELASGVYLYRLRTGDGKQVETRKLLLLR